jgi:hypothetical protein
MAGKASNQASSSNLAKSQSPLSARRGNADPENVNGDPVQLTEAHDGENDHAWELFGHQADGFVAP